MRSQGTEFIFVQNAIPECSITTHGVTRERPVVVRRYCSEIGIDPEDEVIYLNACTFYLNAGFCRRNVFSRQLSAFPEERSDEGYKTSVMRKEPLFSGINFAKF